MLIQIIGLPGSGKTALAEALKDRINAIHLNADEVRQTINADLGFSIQDRIEHATRLGEMGRLLSKQGFNVIVDFICPTKETRRAFGFANMIIWVDRISESKYEDTNAIWEEPSFFDIRILEGYTIEEEVNQVIQAGSLFDWSAPSTLMLGRYQPWHNGHQALKEQAHKRTEQVVVGVRNTYKTSDKDPFTYDQVKEFILEKNPYKNTNVLRLPNITNIVYGRDVGYAIEKIDLPADIEAISSTQTRKDMGL